MKIDFLSRQPYLDLLKSIIANQCNNPTGYSFAIDGEWGCGKTWILTELEKQLTEDSEKKYLIFHYNAWENDFYDEPLVAILSVMIEELNKVTSQKSIYDAAIDELLKQASADLLTLVSGIVKEVTKIDAEEIIKRKKGFFKRIKENTKLSAKDINTLVPLQHTLQEVRNTLKRLSEKFHIILIVDELDRCLPEYAIKVLERLHHICNEIPVIQIITINKRHLADSVAKVFGKEYLHSLNMLKSIEQFSDFYLQKFINLTIPLPKGKLDNKLDVLNGFERDYKLYIRKDMAERDFIIFDDDFLLSFIVELFNGVEKRTQEKIFSLVKLCHTLTIESGITIEEERCTYAILIYEILSCVQKYVYHSNRQLIVRHPYNGSDKNLSLFFFDSHFSNNNSYEIEHKVFNTNLSNFFNTSVQYEERSQNYEKIFLIQDTKSYIMSFFSTNYSNSDDPLQKELRQWISEDKKFLTKYDEIMDMLVAK